MLYILDGSGFLFRAYYSLPDIKDKNGNSAGAIFGFFRMILKLLHQKPDYFVIVFDPGDKTKRMETFKDYKANRPQIEDKFKNQIPKIIDILKKSNFDIEILPGYEADDVIYSIVKNYNGDVTIVSSDKDLKQLITDRIRFLDPKSMELIDKNKFIEEYGFTPEGMVLYLALVGDSSDNIPGIKGIGKKTAQKIVQQFSTYDMLMENIDKLSSTIAEKIEQQKNLLEENIKLIKLIDAYTFDVNELKKKSDIKNIDFDKLKDILMSLYGFKSFEKLIYKTKNIISTPNEISLF